MPKEKPPVPPTDDQIKDEERLYEEGDPSVPADLLELHVALEAQEAGLL